ncbi:MAG: VCBS repeat-containing protein [Deltaproteobacteria bacterium]|nr:VCBS repeat-containing protein [Deltaproteobacteria bacterium]
MSVRGSAARVGLAVLGLSLAPGPALAQPADDRVDEVLRGVLAPLLEGLRSRGCNGSGGVRVDSPLGSTRALQESAGRLLTGACGAPSVGLPSGPTTGSEEALARDLEVLLALRFDGQGRRLALAATLHRFPRDPWRDFLATPDGRDNAEARLERTLPVSSQVARRLGLRGRGEMYVPVSNGYRAIPTPFRSVVALQAADLDGDGGDELVLVSTDRVRVARFTGTTLTFLPEGPRGAASLAALGWAPVPLRQPLGSAAPDADGRRVLVRTSAQGSLGAVSLNEGAVTVAALGRVDAWPAEGFGCVTLAPGGSTVRGVLPGCQGAPSPWPPGEATAAVPVAREFISIDGTSTRWELRTDGEGSGQVRAGDRTFPLADVASPVALEDLDDDGEPELVTASASAPGAPDRLRVFTLTSTGVVPRATQSIPAALEALAVGDLDGDGFREVVAAFRDPQRRTITLWVFP